jgi:CelD/BcsL family acetyltransferase involved in cellulose biosynthesis
MGRDRRLRMNGRLIPVRDMSTSDERRWRELAARAIDPNPFGEPDCVIPAARYQAFGSEIVLAVVERDDRFVASLPLRPFKNWYEVSYPIMANRIRRGSNIGSPLLDPEAAPEALDSLFTALAQQGRQLGRLLGIDSLRVGGEAERLLLESASRLGLHTYVREHYERGFLVRNDSPDYTQHLDAKYLYNVRSRRRRIADFFGEPPVMRDLAQDPEAITKFIELEAAGYKADNIALAAVPGDSQYFGEMCARFAQQRRLHVLSLEAKGVTLAMLIWLRAEDGYFQVKTAYDERYRRFGPGILLQLDSFSFFHEQTDASWLDTCASPDNETFLTLFPDRTHISTLLFSLGGRVDGLFVHAVMPRRNQLRRVPGPLKRIIKKVAS